MYVFIIFIYVCILFTRLSQTGRHNSVSPCWFTNNTEPARTKSNQIHTDIPCNVSKDVSYNTRFGLN